MGHCTFLAYAVRQQIRKANNISSFNKSTTLLSSSFSENGDYISGCVGAWRYLGYGVPELPPDSS